MQRAWAAIHRGNCGGGLEMLCAPLDLVDSDELTQERQVLVVQALGCAGRNRRGGRARANVHGRIPRQPPPRVDSALRSTGGVAVSGRRCAAAPLCWAVALALWTVARAASAGAPPARVAIDVASDAPACPDAGVLRAAVAKSLGAERLAAEGDDAFALRFDVRFSSGEAGSVATVQETGTHAGQRTIVGAGEPCAEMTEAVAIAVTMMVEAGDADDAVAAAPRVVAQPLAEDPWGGDQPAPKPTASAPRTSRLLIGFVPAFDLTLARLPIGGGPVSWGTDDTANSLVVGSRAPALTASLGLGLATWVYVGVAATYANYLQQSNGTGWLFPESTSADDVGLAAEVGYGQGRGFFCRLGFGGRFVRARSYGGSGRVWESHLTWFDGPAGALKAGYAVNLGGGFSLGPELAVNVAFLHSSHYVFAHQVGSPCSDACYVDQVDFSRWAILPTVSLGLAIGWVH
jgi:hypothetical protein